MENCVRHELVRESGEAINFYYAASERCNLRCRYCYLPEEKKGSPSVGSEAAIKGARRIVERFRAAGRKIGRVCLHGAEPTLLPSVAMGRVLNLFSEASNHEFPMSMQTNGTLLTENFFDSLECSMLPEVRLRIGVSIDGPEIISDAIRGKGVYARAWRGLETSLKRGYAANVLCVLGSHTLERLGDFEAWMNELVGRGIDIRFKPASGIVALDAGGQVSMARWLNATGYARFYDGLSTDLCVTKGNRCFWLQIDADGNCYSCNKAFNGEQAFADIRDSSIAAIEDRRQRLFLSARQSEACAGCELSAYCGSGCPKDRCPDGTALDCILKRELVGLAAKDHGASTETVFGLVTRFQRKQKNVRWAFDD